MHKQITLNLKYKKNYSYNSFITSNCNFEAKKLIDTWPNYKKINSIISLYGPKGCGKTHLANIWSIKNNARFITKLDTENFFKNQLSECFVLENLNEQYNWPERELFHFFNIISEKKCYLLITSTNDLSKSLWKLNDLKSRINSIYKVLIGFPDDDLLIKVMRKLFEDRQLVISRDLMNFTINRIERSFNSIYDFVEIVDKLSLSIQRPITKSLLKNAINLIK